MDCLVVGYNDIDFTQYEERLVHRDADDPERRIFMREHVRFGGERYPYMEAINKAIGASNPGDRYLHQAEVPSLAAAYLTHHLMRNGLSADFVSLFGPERERIAELMTTERPKVVAITTTYYVVPWPVVEIVSYIRELDPECHVVVGGPLVNNLCSDLEDEALAEVFEWIDADVFVKESQGEATLVQVVKAAKNGRRPSLVPNIYYRNGSGRFEFTRAQAETNVMDDCGIDWRRFSSSDLGPTLHTRTARSCAFKCAFCDYPTRAGKLDLASVDSVEDELRAMNELGVKQVVFIDDTFNVPVSRFKEICRMMARNDFDFRWYSFFRGTSARDSETFDLMQDSGCEAVFLGIESGDNSILKNMAKQATTDQYLYALDELHSRDITTFASFITGFPGETEDTVSTTIDFINAASPTYYRVEPFWFNHRSPIGAMADKYGLTGKAYDWQHDTMNISGACDATDEMFERVETSLWMPAYNFDFWALPYLHGKGFTSESVHNFHQHAEELMAVNDAPDSAEVSGEALLSSFDSLEVLDGRYERREAASVSAATSTPATADDPHPHRY